MNRAALYRPAHGGRPKAYRVWIFNLTEYTPPPMTKEQIARRDQWREVSRNDPNNACLTDKEREALTALKQLENETSPSVGAKGKANE